MTDALSSGLGLEGTLSLAGKMQEREKQAQSKATKQAEAQIISQEGQYSKPAPEFKMTDETASGFAALGALIAASGAILGSNGRSSGIMAMNAVSGMMNGYNSGRKDLYEQKRVEFEENMKKWEKDRQMIKEIFDRALKVAPTNLKLAQDMLNRDLTAIGQKPLAEMAQRSGPMPAAAAFYKADASIKSKVDPLKDLLGTATSGLNQQQKQYYDSLPTNQARMDYLQSVQADVKAKTEAQKATEEETKRQLDIQEKQQKLALGGKTEAQIQREKENNVIAQTLKANNKAPSTEREIEAWGQVFGTEKFPQTAVQYGPMAVFERAVPGSSTAFKDKSDRADAQGLLVAENEARKIVAASMDPDIAFGKLPTTLQRIDQSIRANLEGFRKADATGVLPNGKTVDQAVEDIINSTPVDPNDKNAVFQKQAAFAALAIERAARGGSMLPLGFLKTLGPLLDPAQYTRASFQGVYADRAREIDDKMASYGFNKEERKKIFDTYSDLRGVKTPSIEDSISQSKSDPIKDSAIKSFGSYEPEIYEYRINPSTNKVERRKKDAK